MVTDTNTTNIANDAGSANESAVDTALEGARSFLETAQDAISSAVDATVEAVKENPVAAAAIAAGAAAAVGGAVYAATQLGGDKGTTAKKSPSAKK
ncbi:MAG: hypothetical protein EOP61_07825 [Sphingomonadales bacterium]|nr:MAG: hypothetical protein EOP61_07825 [Sphingomonadales bacterium]